MHKPPTTSPSTAAEPDERRLVLCLGTGLGDAAQALWAELGAHGWRCHHVVDIGQALQAASALRFDALLVSDEALAADLVSRLTRLRQALAGALLVLAVHGDEIDEILALELGADDYLYPPFHPRRLRARLQAALRAPQARTAAAPAAMPLPMVRNGWSLDLAHGLLRGAGHELRLTAAQAGVLALLLERAGQGVARDELALRLGLPAGVPLGRSVDMHLHHLRRRLAEAGIDGLVLETVRGMGYLLRTRHADTAARLVAVG